MIKYRHCRIVAGKQGGQCNSDCPNIGTCLQCNQFNGQCLKCSNGLYGRLCDKICGHCQSDSKGVVVCDIDTGNCPYACANGYYGSNCNQECSGNCLDSVLNTDLSTCDKESGHCNFGCVPGRYGGVCEYNCNDTCRRVSCDSKMAQWFSRSDQTETSNNLFTIVGCLIGSFIILFSAVTIWFIKRGVCSGKCFNSKCNSEVSFPVTTAPFFDGDSEDLGNTVEIYHHIIDTDHSHQTGSGSSSNDYDEVQ
ncbi:cell death abnormality protein 1-like [Mercenaria mercenaria]|uniref:cell death abnormality protein 1-like n=1 Tax=Mercenaria mercenaria TaxID=6596 RepID=UPI00234F2271|nr:cell death abnormality protein 1-like [Mercenaria mercenaria]